MESKNDVRICKAGICEGIVWIDFNGALKKFDAFFGCEFVSLVPMAATLKGFVSSAGPDDFAFTERDSGKTTTVAYADVVEVKKPGGLSKGAKIAIVAGIGAGVVGGLIVIHSVHCIPLGCR